MPVLYFSCVPEGWGRRTNISTEYDMCSMYEVYFINNFPLEILCHRAVIDYYTRTSNGDMVIRREGMQWRFKPEKSRGVAVAPAKIYGCAY